MIDKKLLFGETLVTLTESQSSIFPPILPPDGAGLPGIGEPRRGSKFGRKMARLLKNVSLETCEPEVAVSVLRLPTMKTYTALKKKLKAADGHWMQGFLEVGGLQVSSNTFEPDHADNVHS